MDEAGGTGHWPVLSGYQPAMLWLVADDTAALRNFFEQSPSGETSEHALERWPCTNTSNGPNPASSSLPSYYEGVWVVRVK